MLTTLLTAVLCTPGIPGPDVGPCPVPASFRYVFRAPAGPSDDPSDELDELIDLAELAEEWGHAWPPPEWEGFDPWAPDGPWAEAWDDLDDPPGMIFGPADRDIRPFPPQNGTVQNGTVQNGTAPNGTGQNAAASPENVPLETVPSEEVSVRPEVDAEPKPKTKSSDERRPRAKSEEPPGVEVRPRTRPGPRGDGDRDSSPGAIALRAATKWLGIPYVWGGGNASGPSRGIGKGANRVGFDCSGLTLAAWAKAGVTLGHYTGTQIKQGKPVQTKDLLPGDLLFFGATRTDPSHVGIYAGDGDMIHAPRTGDVVKRVEVLTAPFWTKRFQGAVRPQPPASKT